LKHERFHGFRTARCAAAGASPVATVRRPVGAKNGSYKVCPPVAGPQGLSCGFSTCLPAGRSAEVRPVVLPVAVHSALPTPHSALGLPLSPEPALSEPAWPFLWLFNPQSAIRNPQYPPPPPLPAIAFGEGGSAMPFLWLFIPHSPLRTPHWPRPPFL
jgi:hypothetical protein